MEEIIYKRLADIVPYENNPRINHQAVEAVAASIREFGFKVPIILDRNNVIIAGHTRLLAAESLGMEEVPCIVADNLSDAQAKAYRLLDNRASDLSEWDYDLLCEELAQISTVDMADFGFAKNLLTDLQQLTDFDISYNNDYCIRIKTDSEEALEKVKEIAKQYGLAVKE